MKIAPDSVKAYFMAQLCALTANCDGHVSAENIAQSVDANARGRQTDSRMAVTSHEDD